MTCKVCSWKYAPFLIDEVCYCCDFWLPFIASQSGLRHRGVHYTVAGDLEPTSGCYPPDTRWEFSLTDGRVLICTNVKCQGGIPPRFLELLPNNVIGLRTTWRNQDDVPEGLGFGNATLFKRGITVTEQVVALPKPRLQSSLLDLL